MADRDSDMDTHEGPDPLATLALDEQLAAAPRMPPTSLVIRLKTSMWLRWLMPSSLVVRRAESLGERLWTESPVERDEALAAMESIVAATPLAAELIELAKAHLIERKANEALFWQPWRMSRIDARSQVRLREAFVQERGVLLSACHQGPYHRASLVTVPRVGLPYLVSGEWYFGTPSHDYWGRRLARWRKGSRVRRVKAKGSYPVVSALLQRRECVMLYYDVPGRRETHFLGKPAMLADGTARLALETDALVLPVRHRRAGHVVWLDVGAPLDSRAFAGVDELHRALASAHEGWILECAARMDDPAKFGWQDGARPQAWNRSGVSSAATRVADASGSGLPSREPW